ncbi:MAG TPA: DUF1003 domain-containing protein [Bryobacteraceae bacterium]|nr:DUF1003 domain-containing protein [Bryobacteraceae bacterium]
MSEQNTFEAIRRNIDTIARMEEKYLTSRGLVERAADAIAAFSGSMTFVGLHVLWYSLWILINLRVIPFLPAFDPYPFMLLNMMVSLEAILLSTFVLMKQNRMSKRADSRAHLDLQINLLAEKEMTMVLQMLRHIGDKVGVRDEELHREVDELTAETPVEMLAEEIEEKLSQEG